MAILARNSRAFAEVVVAVSRIGADLVYLNTGASADQISMVLRNERVDLVVRDSEFAHLCPPGVSWLGTDDPAGVSLLDSLPSRRGIDRPERSGQHIILTAVSGAVPLRHRARESADGRPGRCARRLPGPPRRHPPDRGAALPRLGLDEPPAGRVARSTELFLRRNDPERILALVQAHEVDTLVTVPTVLAKIMALPPTVRDQYDTTSLRCVAVSGSGCPATWRGTSWTSSAMCSTTSTAPPRRLSPPLPARATCATTPTPRGCRCRGESRHPRPARQAGPRGEVGRVYVLSRTSFDGYTDGTDREQVRGMVFTGDLGRLDDKGRLSLIGRADDVIVTAGEKVHPVEVEQVLGSHPALADIAVVGERDNVYGATVHAYVVLEPDADESDLDDVRALARTRLGPRHRPRTYTIVSTLPRPRPAKARRRALVDPEGDDEPEWL